MEDAYSLYRTVKEKAKEWDEERLSRDFSYRSLEAMYPHVAREILLKARLRDLRRRASEAKSLSERQRIKLEEWKVKREIQRERLLQRTRWECLQWRSRDLRSVPRRALEKLGVSLKKMGRRLGREFWSLRRRISEAFFRALPPSISYLGTWGFSSEELVRWSRGYLRAKMSKPLRRPLKPPRKPSIRRMRSE
jgi:hypothetical protein